MICKRILIKQAVWNYQMQVDAFCFIFSNLIPLNLGCLFMDLKWVPNRFIIILIYYTCPLLRYSVCKSSSLLHKSFSHTFSTLQFFLVSLPSPLKMYICVHVEWQILNQSTCILAFSTSLVSTKLFSSLKKIIFYICIYN